MFLGLEVLAVQLWLAVQSAAEERHYCLIQLFSGVVRFVVFLRSRLMRSSDVLEACVGWRRPVMHIGTGWYWEVNVAGSGSCPVAAVDTAV